jgi:hypothetical protein
MKNWKTIYLKNYYFVKVICVNLFKGILGLIILFTASNMFAQDYSELRKKIVPLHSSRKDVEKFAHLVKDDGINVKYKIDGRTIVVRYSNGNCINSPWNVPKDRVLSYVFYPKPIFLDESLKIKIKDLPVIVDDTYTHSYINESEGMEYFLENGTYLSLIGFIPSTNDSSLRCKDYPKYDPVGESYSPFDLITVPKISEFELWWLDTTLLSVKSRNNYQGYVFLYCSEDQNQACEKLRENIENYAKMILKSEFNRISILAGGYRSKVEVETFILSKDKRPPKPTPTKTN